MTSEKLADTYADVGGDVDLDTASTTRQRPWPLSPERGGGRNENYQMTTDPEVFNNPLALSADEAKAMMAKLWDGMGRATSSSPPTSCSPPRGAAKAPKRTRNQSCWPSRPPRRRRRRK